ncbi:hypothetical protein ABKA04_002829 [Annulohypoxylon sp. FPYF3050]
MPPFRCAMYHVNGVAIILELKKCLQSLRSDRMLSEEKAIRQRREQARELDEKLVITAANVHLELQKTASELKLFRELALVHRLVPSSIPEKE